MDQSITEQRIQAKNHHHENGYSFRNVWSTWRDIPAWEFTRYYFGSGPSIQALTSEASLAKINIDQQLPIVHPECHVYPQNPGDIQVTWCGHSSFLLRINGPTPLTVLTDPVFGDRASPLSFAGPKRYRSVPIKIGQITPKVDVVVLSHDHYDHLCRQTIGELEQFHQPVYYVPLGFNHLERFGVPTERVVKLDWYTEATHDGYKFIFVPAQHHSGRRFIDAMQSLWGGWIIQFPVEHQEVTVNRKIYFAGDTAYCTVFKDIGQRYGPIDLGIIPIGAYGAPEYREFLKVQHVDVPEAVKIFHDTQCQKAIGCHWGTFALTNEPLLQPRDLLREEAARQQIDFTTMNHGQTLIV